MRKFHQSILTMFWNTDYMYILTVYFVQIFIVIVLKLETSKTGWFSIFFILSALAQVHNYLTYN